ncbi:sulfite exporter TauE/SafE family protein [Marinimicrobium sp. ABcell2]|uniref:sulfite exporter TauE/SafE family protein n=1 Tax=Marinimicrobium sp. ABcell2 TaxID=3069751 RepID=UPI0027B3B1EE|nr:sulfite exporter TauE/SafE family protein [Marinimicrobium sp. ABcell2]MDQ2078460.1 sulfite exporter TauE/SafE family protein [Marinimicrobium sp. ABcell2]
MIDLLHTLAPVLVAAFALGLFSSAHCVGMCGGIMGALTVAIPESARGRRGRLILSYNLGRLLSYSLMGLLVGLLAAPLGEGVTGTGLRVLAGLLLIAMGLYLGNWWRGLTWLERGGSHLWRYIQPLSKSLMPVKRAPQALLLGGLWGWLPCGLVYTALAYALAQAHPLSSAAVMLAFGLGTLPAVLATGFAAHTFTDLLRRPRLRWSFAVLIILFGVWTLVWTGYHTLHHHADGAHFSAPETSPHRH